MHDRLSPSRATRQQVQLAFGAQGCHAHVNTFVPQLEILSPAQREFLPLAHQVPSSFVLVVSQKPLRKRDE